MRIEHVGDNSFFVKTLLDLFQGFPAAVHFNTALISAAAKARIERNGYMSQFGGLFRFFLYTESRLEK